MGAVFCCSRVGNLNKYSKKFLQVVEKSKKLKVCVYDIEYEKMVEYEQNMKVFDSLSGISQVSFDSNCLYLCGNPDITKALHEGSYLLKIELANGESIKLSILINSYYSHYEPSMAKYGDSSIVVVGGKDTRKCEIYNTSTNKWKTLPTLPEDRYGASLCCDELGDVVYLFGGYNTKIELYEESILTLNISRCIDWERIILKENADLLRRSFSVCARISSGYISIFGGSTYQFDKTDTIVEFDIVNQRVMENERKLTLTMPAKFNLSNYIDLNCKDFFFMDSSSLVHKFKKNDFHALGGRLNSFIFNTFANEALDVSQVQV